MVDLLWMTDPHPQVRFSTFPSQRCCTTMISMFNDSKWEIRSYPRLFHAQSAESLGITRHGLFHTDRYPVVLPGIRMDRESFDRLRTPRWADQSWENETLRLRAAVLKFPYVAASHASAARVYGWPLPPRLMTNRLHVSTNDLDTRIRMPQVTLHRTPHFSKWRWLDLPVLKPEDVFISLATELSLHDLVMLGDAAIGKWHGPPQTNIADLRRRLDGYPRVCGRRHLLEALELIRPKVDSPAETKLRLWARAVGLPEPVVHPQIRSRLLTRVIEPDLGYPDKKLALEYEGEQHLRSKDQWIRDIDRDEAMIYAGWTVLKVTSRTDMQQLEAKIRDHLDLL